LVATGAFHKRSSGTVATWSFPYRLLSAKTVDDSFAGAILAFGIVYAVASYLLMRGEPRGLCGDGRALDARARGRHRYMFRSGGCIFAGKFAIAAFNALVLFLLLGTKSAREFFSRTPATSP
jgi:hypothetical protein